MMFVRFVDLSLLCLFMVPHFLAPSNLALAESHMDSLTGNQSPVSKGEVIAFFGDSITYI